MNNIAIEEKSSRLIVKGLKDFNLKHIFECGQAFRWENVDESYIAVHRGLVAEFYMEEDVLIVENSSREDFQNVWWDYFDLSKDYGKIKDGLRETEAYSQNDSLKIAMDFGYGIRILKQDEFEMIISFIISANNQIPRIKKSIDLIAKTYGKFIENYKGKDYYAFPEVEALASAKPEDLKAICRVGFRDQRIVDTAKIYRDKKEDFSAFLSDDKLKENLLALPGVGPKVCDCIMLFGYARNETFPVDVWVKRLMETLYLEETISNKEIMKYADNLFGTLKGYAQQYLFYYARENAIGK